MRILHFWLNLLKERGIDGCKNNFLSKKKVSEEVERQRWKRCLRLAWFFMAQAGTARLVKLTIARHFPCKYIYCIAIGNPGKNVYTIASHPSYPLPNPASHPANLISHRNNFIKSSHSETKKKGGEEKQQENSSHVSQLRAWEVESVRECFYRFPIYEFIIIIERVDINWRFSWKRGQPWGLLIYCSIGRKASRVWWIIRSEAFFFVISS